MNIDNEKISGRQLGRMVFYDFFALTTLVLPGMLAKAVGVDGFFVLVAGCAGGFVLLLLVLVQVKQMRAAGVDYNQYLSERFGTRLTAVILMVYLLTAFFGAAYGMRFLCGIARQYLIRDTPAWLVLAVLAVLAVYGLHAGVESRGRMYEILFWFVLLPLCFLFFLAAYNVDTQRWVPVFRAEGVQVIKNSYLVAAFFISCVFLPMMSAHVSEHADVARVLKQGFAFGVCANLALFLLLIGIFGAPTVATMEEAVLTLTGMVKVPGGFLERQDALLSGIWLISIFAFVENALYYAVWCMKRIGRTHLERWMLPVAGIVVYALAFGMYRSADFASQLSRLYVRIAVPVLVGIVLVVDILSAWRNRTSASRKNTVLSREKTACKEKNR